MIIPKNLKKIAIDKLDLTIRSYLINSFISGNDKIKSCTKLILSTVYCIKNDIDISLGVLHKLESYYQQFVIDMNFENDIILEFLEKENV